MNEEIQTNTIGYQPVNTQPQPPAPPKYTIFSWIAIVYVVLVVITALNTSELLGGILFWVYLIMGVVAGVSIIFRILRSSPGHSPIVRLFTFLVAIGGGGTVFVISFFAGMIGYFKNVQISGD